MALPLTVDRARKFLETALPRLSANQKAMLRDIREGSCDMQLWHLREALGSAVFDAIGLDASNNALEEGYGEVRQDWREFCRIRSASNFKALNVSALGGFANPPEVKENAPYTEAAMVDQKVSYAVAKYGFIERLSMEALANDEMGAFQRRVRDAGNAFGNLLNETIIGTLIDGSTTFDVDATAVFHANHSNLNTLSALSMAEVSDAIATLMNQLGRNSEKIYLEPRGLLVSPANFLPATEITSSQQKAGGGTTVPLDNAVARMGLKVVASPHVDSVATTWYLFSNRPLIEIAFLNGKQVPEVFMEPENSGGQFYNDSIGWKFRLPFGAEVIDYRPMVKCTA